MSLLIVIVENVSDRNLLYHDQGGNHFEAGRYCCAVSKKEITNQKVVLLKPSGQVVLESVAKKTVYPEMRCPVTGKKLRDKDILPLVPGGTSFASHNEVNAESYRPGR
eukprot:gb/GECG01013620.1/.p1 GENE.gb/GECG01013620.1/~~gb/GECG01013620.1/.p1  ORF type:complete len:108 (+),score=11.19 gb/GECG01013620.1/:1-324(+)